MNAVVRAAGLCVRAVTVRCGCDCMKSNARDCNGRGVEALRQCHVLLIIWGVIGGGGYGGGEEDDGWKEAERGIAARCGARVAMRLTFYCCG